MNELESPRSAFEEAAQRIREGADRWTEARQLVEAMTLDEKLDCLDGDIDFWPGMAGMREGSYHRQTWPAAQVERLGVPGIHFVDGPRGCVIDAATCFPVSMARGASFDPELEERIGDAIGAEMRAVGANFTGAVCLNLLRHPGWGRAQETYGEDPHHVGEMAAAFTRGLQRHLLACMKHFACNSMENARFKVDVRADERALHEVYLPHFRRVAEEGVASTMSAYNSLNGEWCGDSRSLLTEILRDEWQWDGFVITDFIFGLRDPVASVKAGCDIEMPFRQQRVQSLATALDDGRLASDEVDACVARVVATLLRFAERLSREPDRTLLACTRHRRLSHDAAIAGSVLLRNENALPLDRARLQSIAVLGRLADIRNLGDGGSSEVLPPEVTTPLAGLRAALPDTEVVFSADDASIAQGADATLVVVGSTKHDEGEFLGTVFGDELAALFPPRPDRPSPQRPRKVQPSEEKDDGATARFAPGGDRRSLRLSETDEALIAAAAQHADGPVIVVMMGGSAFVVPWLTSVGAALHVFYSGMEGGHALADVLLGDAEPGGRLPFAVPHDERDLVPFDPDATTERYDLLHGQWYLDAEGVAAHLPFGHGLGYTSWVVESLEVDAEASARARVAVKNTGHREGSTVVFAFAGLPSSRFERPARRLLGFARARATAGSTQIVELPLDWRQLDVRSDGAWISEPGRYELEVGFAATRAEAAVVVAR